MNASQATPLDLMHRLLTLTQRQAEAAQAGDWELVDRLLDEREPLVDQAVAIDLRRLEPVLQANLQTLLGAVLDLDQHIRQQTVEASEAARRQLAVIQRGRRAVTAYGSPPPVRLSLLDQGR
jgi:enoyl-CoA hydratase/carnithine racemase